MTPRRVMLIGLCILALCTMACNFVIDTGGEDDGITLEEHDHLAEVILTTPTPTVEVRR